MTLNKQAPTLLGGTEICCGFVNVKKQITTRKNGEICSAVGDSNCSSEADSHQA